MRSPLFSWTERGSLEDLFSEIFELYYNKGLWLSVLWFLFSNKHLTSHRAFTGDHKKTAALLVGCLIESFFSSDNLLLPKEWDFWNTYMTRAIAFSSGVLQCVSSTNKTGLVYTKMTHSSNNLQPSNGITEWLVTHSSNKCQPNKYNCWSTFNTILNCIFTTAQAGR